MTILKRAIAIASVAMTALACLPVPSQISAKTIDSCSLLEQDALERLISRALRTSGQYRGTPSSNTCTYESVGAPRVAIFIDASVGPDAGFAWSARSRSGDESIGGLGDYASWFAPYRVLHVLAGRAFFAVQTFGLPEPVAKRTAVAAGRDIAGVIAPIGGT